MSLCIGALLPPKKPLHYAQLSYACEYFIYQSAPSVGSANLISTDERPLGLKGSQKLLYMTEISIVWGPQLTSEQHHLQVRLLFCLSEYCQI